MSGGLAMFWRDTNLASLIGYSNNHIDVIVSLPDKPQWRLTGFYGYPERSRRHQSWDLLRTLSSVSNLPWMVVGDFNDIACHSEKRGLHLHPGSLIEGFTAALHECHLNDLGMVGPRFTWERGRGTDTWVEERLDRAVASLTWTDIFEEVEVRNVLALTSNHCAIFLDLEAIPLWKWGGEYFRRFGDRVNFLRRRLEFLRDYRSPVAVNEYKMIESELCALLLQEEIFWRQRSKQLWLKHGDLNTKIFHQSASARRRHNRLTRLRNSAGVWVEGQSMAGEVLHYFQDIFSSSGTSVNLFNRVQTRVTEAMNTKLLQPFTMEEIKTALFAMAPEKAPGPDEKAPERVTDLRPIALCNVAYKVMAKVIANRMKDVLDYIISPSQSAFVPDRLLTDNIIVAGEVGHYLRVKKNGAVGWAALKLDMAKSYDRMEWQFLEGMMLALGFAQEWVNLIMLCVSSVRYSLLVNGEPIGMINPTRGIRQGDPLSPYLFIICADGLSVLLQKAEARGDIHGVKVARGAPSVSHLFFADDSLLFFKACHHEAQTIKQCLAEYSSASGQLVNFDKSSIIFSSNTSTEMRELVESNFGVRVTNDFGRYLGLPSVMGNNKTTICWQMELAAATN
ncbi:uncharacterized protein LOC116015853 [Ipomoea triloba]|uniref:uncharacterized protein LOC116015853 n=1 Tax=Ipomoea triloba TaxID=35885 RepID=UPI00125E6167|nr:uncharacterized protein LOC116015853 [Ipomoea triloba]